MAEDKDALLAFVASQKLRVHDDDCEVTGLSGSGRCIEPAAAIRWEAGFLDLVCTEHAARAEGRGALVVFPAKEESFDG